MRFLSLLAFVAVGVGSPALAQSLRDNEVLSSIAARPLSQPLPVLGADNRVHLAYELLLSNTSKLFLTVDKVEAVDPSGKALWSLEGEQLDSMTMLYSGEGSTLPPGGTGIIFMDVSFAPDEQLPETVAARITGTRQRVGPDGRPAPIPAGTPVPPTLTFIATATVIGGPARIIDPPLRGSGWVATNGCCDRITPHRGAIMTVNGSLRLGQRFAIDWMRIDEDGRASTGDIEDLANWPFYGAPVYSVAEGTVVNLYDGADEQVPGSATGIIPANIGGNMIVVDIGDGAYAFYGHLQRGSLKAKLGDQVQAGQVLGLLGNTGNSTAPHLHFHLMDGPSPLNSNGLPYIFRRFTSEGVVPAGEEDAIDEGRPVTPENRLAGEHVNQLPLDNQVVTFD